MFTILTAYPSLSSKSAMLINPIGKVVKIGVDLTVLATGPGNHAFFLKSRRLGGWSNKTSNCS
jgi:hypothetical protein